LLLNKPPLEGFEMRPHFKIVSLYFFFGALWIFFSDLLVENIFNTTQELTFVQNIKGWLFIAVTGIALFVLIKKALDEKIAINRKLINSYDQTIRGWIKVMDLRHQETKDHTTRVSKMTVELSKHMGITEREELKRIETSAILHDVGKIGIPDSILIKPGPLTSEEFDVIKTHPQIAYDILYDIDYLRNCIDIPFCHHEKWNGEGYPRGISGDTIPIAARIFAVIDVWDALTHARVYKDAWPESKVLQYIEEKSGNQFDPSVVKTFLNNYKTITKCIASD
jgi:HD-GYP domain-containing protein (c-di-GMP phosphodiesterase class II)